MGDRVAVVAVSQTLYERSKDTQRPQEMLLEVVMDVRRQTGLGYGNEGLSIHGAITCSDDFWDARTISNAAIGDIVGAHRRAEEKVAQTGTQAVLYAMACILSGHYEIMIVAGHRKESLPASRNLVTHHAFEPYLHRPVGLDFLSCAALQARIYHETWGVGPERWAEAVVKSHGNGRRNPKVTGARELEVEDVLGSAPVAEPLRELDIYPVTDGAVAMILASDEWARKITDRPVWILGAGNCYDTYFIGDRDLARAPALTKAAKKAYSMAGIREPAKEIRLAELSTHYSYEEFLFVEALGLCPEGQGSTLLEKGITTLDGSLPINPSGGPLVGFPDQVSGLTAVAECVLQLRGEAGGPQVDGARVALAHGAMGPCGQYHSVMILGKA
ncbi:MAG: thiolase C-terminal domain-containing protein [Thermodesulfobacteriota bacterium]